MSGSGRTIYIAGAGIAGLTLALALAKFGATIVLLERSKSVQEIGAGLQISPNARRVLSQLGLERQLQAKAFVPAGIDIFSFRGKRPLVTLKLGRTVAEKFGAPYAVMHRADLADTLYRACNRFANIDVLFGVKNFDVVSHARGISVIVDEGPGMARSTSAFAFIGADGVHSHTRTTVMRGPPASYTGYVAWRITLPQAALETVVAQDKVTVLMAPGYHAVVYPLPHRKQVNVALFARLKEEQAFAERPPARPQLPWAMLRSPQIDAIMEAAGDGWGLWPMATVEADDWQTGGIGLVGDAAHAMTPHQAQGAAMAIEDAAILAPLLMTEPTAEAALERYAAIRGPRVERVRKISASNGAAFHMEWPFTLGRDAVIRMQGAEGHFRRLEWLYGYDPAPEPDISPPPQAVRQTQSR
jgi:salicylate hydroxylase